MKILNLYVTRNFMGTFLMAIGILTFGMTGSHLMKVFEYISSGVPIRNAFIFLLYVLPIVLAFTIPWAALVSVMLVFGRLSADNEITAMRACGVSILQIVAPIIVIAFILTCTCLYLQLQVGPHYLGEARNLVKNVIVEQPTAIFEPGIPIEFPPHQSRDSPGPPALIPLPFFPPIFPFSTTSTSPKAAPENTGKTGKKTDSPLDKNKGFCYNE